MEDIQQRVLSHLDRDELNDMVKDLANIASPTGGEREVAEYLASRFRELGIRVDLQEVETGRSNVVATWRAERYGEGPGKHSQPYGRRAGGSRIPG